ncbi:hypothetical protein L486_05645 [Kwoniella mangroviensis CBS 10435]|uniref:Integral membrane protein n=1 Tax=Kwoniella mangroviensis CBS 10435 TaxID=1331196 RepID=A0A1B9IN43_9TREE|nr:uncharacterized protein I203_07291 [Kwoniella mangroviensis CBS 8507]OCF56790.1 hypothetical protein L486_05645 [Kwoniella mangroviensis CBS 10435]OCF63593.1 hypothetical protein I203_07291 [Kwoniella mangroviensis CBS 8507]
MSNSTVAGAGAGVGMDVNTILWKQMGASVNNTTWYAIIGTVLQSLIVSSILSNTSNYFSYFTQTDSIWLLEAVGLGAILSVGALGLTCAQAYHLVYENEHNIATHFRFLMYGDMSHLLIGAIFNAAGASYYAYRAWRMSGNKWWIIPPFAIGIIAQLVIALVAVGNGLKMPKLTIEAVKDLPTFMSGTITWFRAWGAITCAVDGTLCLFMTFMLFKSKQGIFHNQDRLFKRLISLVYETMMPPVLCLLILESCSGISGSPLTDFRRIFTSILPVLYYHSVLSTLVGRKTIQKILARKLNAEGIEQLSGSGSGSGGHVFKSGGRVYVSRPKGGEKDVELGNVRSPYTPRSKMSEGPIVHVETEQTTTTTGPDGYEIYLPTLGRNRLPSDHHGVNSPDSVSWEGANNYNQKWESTDRLYDGPGTGRAT